MGADVVECALLRIGRLLEGSRALLYRRLWFTLDTTPPRLLLLCRCFFGLGGAKAGPPANYEAITSQAIAAVQSGLRKGEKAMEVEVGRLGTAAGA